MDEAIDYGKICVWLLVLGRSAAKSKYQTTLKQSRTPIGAVRVSFTASMWFDRLECRRL